MSTYTRFLDDPKAVTPKAAADSVRAGTHSLRIYGERFDKIVMLENGSADDPHTLVNAPRLHTGHLHGADPADKALIEATLGVKVHFGQYAELAPLQGLLMPVLGMSVVECYAVTGAR